MSRQVTFLTLAEVLEIHSDQITRYGGANGIRDLGLLKSAIGIPAATFGGEFLHADIAEMAAAYLYHLVSNHAFIDGNKRVGAVSAIVFLSLNGYDLTVTEGRLFRTVMKIAAGDMKKSETVDFIRRHLTLTSPHSHPPRR